MFSSASELKLFMPYIDRGSHEQFSPEVYLPRRSGMGGLRGLVRVSMSWKSARSEVLHPRCLPIEYHGMPVQVDHYLCSEDNL